MWSRPRALLRVIPAVTRRGYSQASGLLPISKVRNIGISAHIDSGKTTLTERVLFYTGRIAAIHEVRGKDGVGAKMDSMDLEREKGITIQSAATYTKWKDHNINIIDTPGHVDFTIEVERALRVLDGAVLVLCSVGGVQSQTMTVDRQMRRYNVPRIAFINKLDRPGANPERVIAQVRDKLKVNAAAVQLPIGQERELVGLVDLIKMKAFYYEGTHGERVREAEVPEELVEKANAKRIALVEALANCDDEIAELFLMEEPVSNELLFEAVRRQTQAQKLVPVMMGSALKNTGIQGLLDGALDFLPDPSQVQNIALDYSNDEKEVEIQCERGDENAPFVGLAFKLEEGRFGQLTYLRNYTGTLKKGDTIYNMRTGKKTKVPRIVRMHSDDMEDVAQSEAGEICALFGMECASGDTFTCGKVKYGMSSMFIPEPVISYSIQPENKGSTDKFSKALSKFQREDPTFKVHLDDESKETIVSGMGELHLSIYVERMKREFATNVITGKPKVAFRERLRGRKEFTYTHKKQTGGSGQYGKLIGYIEPLDEDDQDVIFEDRTVGLNIPKGFMPAIELGLKEACQKGQLTGYPVAGVRMVVEDGMAHSVDSSELAFKMASMGAFRSVYPNAQPYISEPVMKTEVTVPQEYQGDIVGDISKRRGNIADTSNSEDGFATIMCQIPLNEMFGYSSTLRQMTQGKGEFSMEYAKHEPALPNLLDELTKIYQKERSEKN